MLYLGPAAVEALLAIRPQEAVINQGASVFGLSASLAGASMCACFCCCSLLARPADRQLQPVGQLPAVPGANGALGVAVRGLRQGDRHVAVAAGLHRDPPADVAALLQPLRLLDRSAGDREGVVPQGLVAQAELLAEAQLEGEGALPVVGRGDVLQAGGQRRRRQTRHRIRGRAGQLLLVAPVVGEAHPHLDGLAHVVGGQGVG